MQAELTAALAGDLKPLGFRRRRHNLVRAGQELYAVVNVQKSAWDESCYLNLGFAPPDRVADGWLAENRCPIRFRFEALLSARPEDLRLLGPAATGVPSSAAWTSAVTERVVRPIAALLAEIDDLASLGHALRTRVSDHVLLHHDIRGALTMRAASPPRAD
jgi:hypothetical protein